MASFRFYVPDEQDYAVLSMSGDASKDAKLEILRAGAEVLVQRLREFLDANTNDPNAAVRGTLARSIQIVNRNDRVFVEPKGKHHGKKAARTRAEGYHRAKTGQGRGRSGAGKHHGMSSGVSAADVGYYLEYGTPRMSALHWMETVVEQSADEIEAAMQTAFDNYLESRGF